MARIRTVKPEFWGDEKLAPMDATTRLVFLGLFTVMADDAGRMLDSVKQIDGVLFAQTEDSCRESLAKLAESGRIKRGVTHSGQRIIQIVNWHHQKVDHPNLKAALPPIAQEVTPDSRNNRESLANDSRAVSEPTSDQRPATDDQRPTTSVAKGARESNGTGSPEALEELASLIGILPPEARQLLDCFYEPALTSKARDRWRGVAMQLIDALDPKHPGPKIRGGVRVKARSPQHMADVCRSVLADPPMDRDAAIVFVLKKLLDPPKGPSVTEQAKELAEQTRAREKRYHREAHEVAVAWARENDAKYQELLTSVNRQYEGKSGNWIATARETELTHRCAKLAGFPTFEEWSIGTPKTPDARILAAGDVHL